MVAPMSQRSSRRRPARSSTRVPSLRSTTASCRSLNAARPRALLHVMTADRDALSIFAARELLVFYQEAGVDAPVGERPVDRFAAPIPGPPGIGPSSAHVGDSRHAMPPSPAQAMPQPSVEATAAPGWT